MLSYIVMGRYIKPECECRGHGSQNDRRVLIALPRRALASAAVEIPRLQGSSNFDVKILITLPDREGCVRPQELVAEDLGQEDVIGLVLRFEAVAADGGVGRAQVAWLPGFVQRAEGGRNVLGSWGLVVVLTASGEGKLLRSRS